MAASVGARLRDCRHRLGRRVDPPLPSGCDALSALPAVRHGRSRDSRDGDWFFDDQLQDRADRGLEHLFTLLGLLLPAEAVQIAFRALHTEDRELKGTAFEYLESATPLEIRRSLLQFLEADAAYHPRATGSNGALPKLLKSKAHVNQSLSSMEIQR